VKRQIAGFFERLRSAHEKAARTVGERTLSLRIAGHPVSIRAAGGVLADKMLRSLRHLAAEPGTGLTIRAWETAASGVAPPPPAWPAESFGPRGRIGGFDDPRIRVAYQMGADALSLVDLEGGEAVYWVRDAESLPAFEGASPFRIILNWWFGELGLRFVHAGAVAGAGAGALLIGSGGSGKSSTAAACLASPELSFLSDDYCLFDSDDPPRIHSLYSSAKLGQDSVRRLSSRLDWFGAPDDEDGEKRIFYLQERLPGRLAKEAPLSAILLPRVQGGRDSALRPIPQAEAFRALAPSTLFQLPGDDQGLVTAAADLVRRVPSYRLDLGEDVEGILDAIRPILVRRERGRC
jgi:hypothetical protein